MAGFDNRTLRTMQQNRDNRLSHETAAREAIERQAAQRKGLATSALSESFRGHAETAKRQTYEATVTNIIELAHSGHDNRGITREDLQSAAEIALEDSGSSYLEHNIAAIYANFPDFVEAQQTMNTDVYVPKEEFTTAKKNLSKFNTTLKDFIDGDPRIQPQELQRYLQDCALTYGYSGRQLESVTRAIPELLRGMRAELSMESILYRLDGIDIMETTTEDDLNGIDERVLRDDGTEILIDVKASQITADKARTKREDRHRRVHGELLPSNILVITTGMKEDDYSPKTPWRPTEKGIARNIPRIQALIDAVPKQ